MRGKVRIYKGINAKEGAICPICPPSATNPRQIRRSGCRGRRAPKNYLEGLVAPVKKRIQ